MTVRSVILGILALSVVYLGANKIDYNPKEKESAIIDAVLKYLDVLHFSSHDINDTFSGEVYDYYVNDLDPSKRFLIQPEIDQLSAYRTQIDDQIKGKSLEFFDLSLELTDAAILRAEKIFDEVIESKFDLNEDEIFLTDAKERKYSQSEAELRSFWKKALKLDILSKISQELEEEEDVDAGTPARTLEDIQNEAIASTKKNFENWFKRLHKIRRSDRFENFVNSITHCYDPHSDYFNPKEKEDFDIRMGGKLEGIGARLSEDDEYVKVVSIVPGGPAWKGKELEVNDLIIGVAQDGEEAVDITGMRLDEVVAQIRGDKGTLVTLDVKRTDGSIKKITIERDEVILDEGFAKSCITSIPDAIENVGYIYLPKFYSSFEGKEGNSCAKDIEVELEKLKSENVSGVILDLRNNGGGSLQDVITMSGLFIEEGPIVQVKSRERNPYVYEDKDSKVQYDGPVIVLVNQFSASASEILAAALQDYNRAIIVGSTSTFGKGTVQRFQNLDQYIQGMEDMKPLGELKLTTQKFFRIDGGSTQLNGVTPDIVLPDLYNYIESGEKEYEFALPWSQIEPLEYSQDIYNIKDKNVIIERSKDRLASNSAFQTIDNQAKNIKRYQDENEISLNLEKYRAFVESKENDSKQFDEVVENNIEHLKIENLEVDMQIINSDESKAARNEDWILGLKKDIYLEEALYIMKDMIDLNS